MSLQVFNGYINVGHIVTRKCLETGRASARSVYHGPTGRKDMFYLTSHSTHFIYDYMASDIWQRTTEIARVETRFRHYKGCFYIHHIRDKVAHAATFVVPVVEQGWNEK